MRLGVGKSLSQINKMVGFRWRVPNFDNGYVWLAKLNILGDHVAPFMLDPLALAPPLPSDF